MKYGRFSNSIQKKCGGFVCNGGVRKVWEEGLYGGDAVASVGHLQYGSTRDMGAKVTYDQGCRSGKAFVHGQFPGLRITLVQCSFG